MSSMRNRFTVPIAIVMALATAPLLSGCFGNPIEGIIEGATGGNVDIGGSDVPADFPSEVPLIDGDVVFALGLGDDTGKVYTVSIKVSGMDAIEQIAADLEDAGFTAIGELDVTGGAALYENGTWGVAATVTEDGDNGYVATYVVSPVGG